MADPNMENPRTPAEPPPSTPGPAAATLSKPSRPVLDQLPPYRVLLHNDDVNSFDFVIDSIVELTPLDVTRAVEASLEADKTGVALLLVTHQERAELYLEQFTSKQLTVTIEPAE